MPIHLRNAPTKLMKDLDYGKNYKYAHDYQGNFTSEEFLPDTIIKQKFITQVTMQERTNLGKRLKKMWGDKYDY